MEVMLSAARSAVDFPGCNALIERWQKIHQDTRAYIDATYYEIRSSQHSVALFFSLFSRLR